MVTITDQIRDGKSILREEARKLGLDTLGFVSLEQDHRLKDRLAHFLAEGRHGDMEWMEKNADRRGDPLALWPEAKTAIMVGQSYAPAHDPRERSASASSGSCAGA